jgi:aryl-alcohol dehydrogenase-like predicted oxidoreductase
MSNKQISRKEFFSRAVAGIAGIKMLTSFRHDPAKKGSALNVLGRTGINVSPIAFGAPRTNDEALIKYALEKGINFIDTGRAYGNGNNEKLVGRAINGRRPEVIIQSKIRLEENELPSKGKGKKGYNEIHDSLASKLEESLKALNTGYIDVFLYHDAIDEKYLFHDATLKFFSEMKKEGIIRAHGFSAHNDHMNLLEMNNNQGFYDVVMIPFNHKGSFVHSVNGTYSEWDQGKLISILTAAGKKGTGIIAMKTCSGGMYSPSTGIEPSYKEAVLWVLRHQFISSVSVAMANIEQVDEHTSWLSDMK